MDKYNQEQALKRSEEKARLLAIPDSATNTLSVEDKYQRMRYQREEEGNRYVNEIRRGHVMQGNKVNNNTVVVFNRD